MNPDEILASGKPYMKYMDQYIETEKWPDPKCKCKGLGHYGALAPKGQASKDLDIGPNAKCVCNSGKKYKKCCMSKVDRLSKSGERILICQCVGKDPFMANNPYLAQIREEIAQKWKIHSGPTSTETTEKP